MVLHRPLTQQYGFDIIALSQSFMDEIRWLERSAISTWLT